jgi:hypothetical protein
VRPRIRLFRGVGLATAVVLLTALAAPASAARVTHESYSITGVTAEATFGGRDQEPAVGTPQILFAMGADATSVHRVPGVKPERIPQPAILAIGLMMPGASIGDEPYQAELWCVADVFTFTVADDLSGAELQIPTCVAEVVVFDPQTGEEAPNGGHALRNGPVDRDRSARVAEVTLALRRGRVLDHGRDPDLDATRDG